MPVTIKSSSVRTPRAFVPHQLSRKITSLEELGRIDGAHTKAPSVDGFGTCSKAAGRARANTRSTRAEGGVLDSAATVARRRVERADDQGAARRAVVVAARRDRQQLRHGSAWAAGAGLPPSRPDAAVAGEQRRSQCRPPAAVPRGHVRLHGIELGRGAVHAAQPRHRLEDPEVRRVHGTPPSDISGIMIYYESGKRIGRL